MQVEHRIQVNAPSSTIFEIYRDVENWCEWDPDTKSSNISGPFEPGVTGRLTPAKGSTVPMLLTEVVPGKCFTVASKIPMFRMVFEHELSEVGGQTDVVHRVTFSGLLSPILGRVIGKQVDVGLPVTLAKLKALAESRRAV